MLMTQRLEDELTSIDSREPINSNDGIELYMSSDSSAAHLYIYSVQFQLKCTQRTEWYENDEPVAEKTIMDLINLFGASIQANEASQGLEHILVT